MNEQKLYLCTNWDRGYAYAISWIQKQAEQLSLLRGEQAVILPNAVVANHLRRMLASQGISFMNINFWTPMSFRKRILCNLPEIPPIASREELHLILSSVTLELESVTAKTEAEKVEWLHAVSTHPDSILKVFNLLNKVGLKYARMLKELRHIVNLAEIFYKVLEEQWLQTVSTADRFFPSCKWKKEFASLLVFGFHSGHLDLFPLLSITQQISNTLEVLLDSPSDASCRRLDSSWIESWEQTIGAKAILLQGQKQKVRLPVRYIEFLTEESIYNLAWSIALKAAKMVAEGAKALAVVFAAYGPLSREVALALNKLRLPYFDSIGHIFLQSAEKYPWKEWCFFQQSPTIQSFTKFLALLPNQDRSLDLLREASCETLSQNIHVCIEFARLHNDREEDLRSLSSYSLLPECDTLAIFCKTVSNEFRRLGWIKEIDQLQACLVRFKQPTKLLLKRSDFLHWLHRSLIDNKGQQLRDARGSHPYAIIQLVRRDQAALCPWSHVILAGMNNGQWPDVNEDNNLIPTDTMTTLYQQIASSTNRRAFGQRFSNNVSAYLTTNHFSCLWPTEQVAIQRRDFQNLCKAITLVATACIRNASTSSSNISTWFSELYEKYGKNNGEYPHSCFPSSQLYISSSTSPWDKSIWNSRKARLDPTLPFGHWEFTAIPHSSYDISVVDIKRIWKEPAIIWMKIFLGIEPTAVGENAMTRVGTWVHRWLRNIYTADTNWKLPDKLARRQIILAASEATQVAVERAYHAIQQQLPSYWIVIWNQAQSYAIEISDQLEEYRLRFPFIIAEHPFQHIYTDALIIRGKWDLLLSTHINPQPQSIVDASVLIIDYKAGRRPLKETSLFFEDIGLQLALYAQAALAKGARRADATWLSPYSNHPIQMPFEELEKGQARLLSIGLILKEGIFGMRGKLHPEFISDSPMPLATLPIPQDILEFKWKLTQKHLLARG